MSYSPAISAATGPRAPVAPAQVAPGSILFFYSKTCKFCLEFLEELRKTPAYVREFQFVCVDRPSPGQPRPPLPPYVKRVPTMVVPGETEPRVEFMGCMNWLIDRKRTGMAAGPETARTGPAMVVSDPESWAREMGNIGGNSDFTDFNQAYLDVSLKDRVAPTQPGYGELIGGPGPGPGPGPASGDARSAKQSAKSAAFASQYENFLKQRDLGIPKGPGFGPGR